MEGVLLDPRDFGLTRPGVVATIGQYRKQGGYTPETGEKFSITPRSGVDKITLCPQPLSGSSNHLGGTFPQNTHTNRFTVCVCHEFYEIR